MVAVKPLQESKRVDKIPPASIVKPKGSNQAENVQIPLSPKGSNLSLEDEILALRTRNQILTDTLQSIKERAEQEEKKHYDLVWFARYRHRYPLHGETKRIELEQSEELKKLQTNDADFHHGVHAGLLAASRMFKKQADILHINDYEEYSDELVAHASNHKKVIEESRDSFPHVTVDPVPQSK